MHPTRAWRRLLTPSLPIFLLLLAGCAQEPSAPQAGGRLPLQAYNGTNQTLDVRIEVLEPSSRSLLLTTQTLIAPQRLAALQTGLVPHGDYVLVARAGAVTREATVHYDAQDEFYRFLVRDNIIAFQSA